MNLLNFKRYYNGVRILCSKQKLSLKSKKLPIAFYLVETKEGIAFYVVDTKEGIALYVVLFESPELVCVCHTVG